MGAGLEEEREKRPEGKREAQEEKLWESSWAEPGWGGGRKRWALPGHCCPQGDQATMAPLSREDNELIRARVRPAVYN